MVEAGRISLPHEGSRSPSENILIGGGATVGEVLRAGTQTGGSLSNGSSRRSRSSGGNKEKRLAREKAERRQAEAEAAAIIEKERVAVERAAQAKIIQERKDRSIAAATERADSGRTPEQFQGPVRPGMDPVIFSETGREQPLLSQTESTMIIDSYQKQQLAREERAMKNSLDIIQEKINSGDISFKQGTLAMERIQDQTDKRLQGNIKKYAEKIQSRTDSPYFETRQTDTLEGGVPYLEVFHINPETGKERKATVAERKEYKLGAYRVGEVQAKTREQLQSEAGWRGKVFTPEQRDKLKDVFDTSISPIKKSAKSYKEIEKSASDWLYDVTGFTEEKHEKQMKRIDQSTQFLKDRGMAGWLAEAGGSIAKGGGKLAKRTLDKPLKTAVVYGATAAVYPTLAISQLAAPEAIEYGLTGFKKGVSKVDIFGLPVGETISKFLPSTGEDLMIDALTMKGVGKVIGKAPKIIKKGFTRGISAKGGYGLAFGDTPEERAMGLTELGLGLGLEFGEYAGRRLRLQWDKGKVIKYSVEERSKFEIAKAKGAKYKMKARPLIEQEKLRKYVREARDLWKFKPEVRELDLQGMDRISQNARKPTHDWLKANKGKLVVGGTAGTRTQVINPQSYTPHDMDIFTLRGSPENAARSLYNALRKAGVGGYELKGSKLIHLSTGKEAIEFHSYDDFLKANIEQVAPWYQTSRAGITKTPSGIKVLSMRSQIGQKTLGYARSGEARLKDWLYVTKEAKPAQLKAKLAYKDASIPDPWKFEPILTGFEPIGGKAPKRIIQGAPAYEAFDFGFDMGIKTPNKVSVKKSYPKYDTFDNVLYTPYKGVKVSPYTPYKGYPKVKTPYKGYKASPYSPMLSYLTTPYKGYPKVKTPYLKTPYDGTPYRGYPPIKPKPYLPYKKIDPFQSLAIGPPMPQRKNGKMIKKLTKKTKGKKKYVAKITGFEAALGLGPRYVEAGKSFTGFEAVRGRRVIRPGSRKAPKKTKKKKGTRRPGDISRYLY